MKIVVTGALGHIGSLLIRELPVRFPEAEIVMIDNLSCQRYFSLYNLPPFGKFKFIEGDLLREDLLPHFKSASAVVHLAAITNAEQSLQQANLVEKNNFVSTERVANACLETRTPLVFLSTTSVYGTQETMVDEDCGEKNLKPQSPYAITKLQEEKLLDHLGKDKGLNYIICRFGTIFGVSPGMRFHTAVNKFCWQAALQIPLTVWKTAFEQKRPYLDLMDGVRAISFILEKRIFDRNIYNVLTLNTTVEHLVKEIQYFLPETKVTFVDSPIMNQLSYEVSSAKFCRLDFSFQGDLKRAIYQTLSQLKNAYQTPINSM